MLRAAYAGAELHVVEGAGHWVQFEQAGAFQRALEASLKPG